MPLNRPTQNKKLSDPKGLTTDQFLQFVQHMPEDVLQRYSIRRAQFVAVCSMLARHSTFKTGTNIYPSQQTLARESGASAPTVRKVLEVLKAEGVLEVTGYVPNRSGSPTEAYRFRKSPLVMKVLEPKLQSSNLRTTYEVEKTDPLSRKNKDPKWKTEDHNTIKTYYSYNKTADVDDSNAGKDSFASESQEDVLSMDEDVLLRDALDSDVVNSILNTPVEVPLTTEELLAQLIED